MFRFTIRDVLWLTVVVGLGLALWIDRRRIATITADRDHPIFNFQLQIVEHDAVANAVVAEFLGQLLEQHLIGDSSFYFDVVTHAFRVFHMADLAFGVQLVNIKLHKASPFP